MIEAYDSNGYEGVSQGKWFELCYFGNFFFLFAWPQLKHY